MCPTVGETGGIGEWGKRPPHPSQAKPLYR